MELIKPSPYQREDEISLKKLILKAQEWGGYLLSKWLIILIFGILGGTMGILFSTLKKTQYIAELTFVLEDSKSNSLGAYIGLASQFGLDLGGNSGSGIFSGDNIIEFLKSRLMVEKTLLSSIVVNGKEQSLADFYLQINSGSSKQAKSLISFPSGTDRAKFTLQQDSLLQVIYSNIINLNLTVSKPDKKLSFIAVSCSSGNELFSKAFTERLVKEATLFYIQTKTQRSAANVQNLQQKADSIESLLNRKTYSVAAAQDMNLNPARSIAGVEVELASRNKVILQTIYAEVIKNLEISKMAMIQETPIIQIVDAPMLPLKRKKLGWLKGIILGGILGGILIAFLLLCKRLYKEIIS